MFRVLTWSLFVAASFPVSGTVSAQQLLEYPDTVLSGNVSAELPKPLAGCRKLCDERSGCAGFDHASATNTCRMFSSVTAARVSRGSVASTRQAVSGYIDPANLPPPPLPQPSLSAWLHNGSVMVLHQTPKEDGSSDVEIVYDFPKNHLLKVGIRSGSTLFKGRLADGSLVGNARLTSSRCGIIQYEVQGMFDPLSSVPFFLRGAAPKRGSDCAVESWSTTGENANLRFDPHSHGDLKLPHPKTN
ncbi:PAN domain-containing protein [Sinorhizobium fredii]|uniref:PAN domain-containing protein n=1 Tax=Rhizobium fredii TaxID=380 RepID=UPI003395AE2C